MNESLEQTYIIQLFMWISAHVAWGESSTSFSTLLLAVRLSEPYVSIAEMNSRAWFPINNVRDDFVVQLVVAVSISITHRLIVTCLWRWAAGG